MPIYRSHKKVWALKIETITVLNDGSADIVPKEKGYDTFRVSKEYVDRHIPREGGYYVKYKDGYESWSPADAFNEGYDLIKCAVSSFGMAIEALRIGKKVSRKGWNGKGMWLSHVEPYNNHQFDLIEKPGAEGTFLPYIGMKTADNGYVPWLASQTDMLAYDWHIVE